MKVNGTNRIDYVTQTYKKNTESISNSQKKSDILKPEDSIELSEASKELKKQIEDLSKAETSDKQKVNSIKQAIQDGSYKVSPKKLAESMIDKMRIQDNPGEE